PSNGAGRVKDCGGIGSKRPPYDHAACSSSWRQREPPRANVEAVQTATSQAQVPDERTICRDAWRGARGCCEDHGVCPRTWIDRCGIKPGKTLRETLWHRSSPHGRFSSRTAQVPESESALQRTRRGNQCTRGTWRHRFRRSWI